MDRIRFTDRRRAGFRSIDFCRPCGFLLFLCAWVAFGFVSVAHATIMQPNGEYRETMDDLSVKVLGGHVNVSRTWQADDQNKGQFRWYFNPAWADLTFTYDSIDGSVKQITRADASFTKTGTGVFVFDQVFFIKQTTSPSGWRWYDPTGNWITYDANGKIAAYGDRNNVSVTFTRNVDGTINQVKDQNGQAVLTFAYTNNQVTSVSDYSGRSLSYQYSNGQLTDVNDVLGYTWHYGYTGGLLTSRVDPNLHTTSIAYNGNRVVKITDSMQYEWNYSYSYDHFKRVFTVVQTSPAGVRTETHYDPRGRVIYEQVGTRVIYQLVKDGPNVEINIDERGLQTRTVYDTLRNPIEFDYPDGTKATTTYDAVFNNITSFTDELGVQKTYEYDAKGNLTTLTEAVGHPEQRVTTYTYDTFGQRLTQTIKGIVVPDGVTPGPDDTQYQDATTRWTYDSFGNVHTIEDPLHHVTTLTQDVMGNVLSRKDARGLTSAYEYKASGWPTKITDPLQHSVGADYDKVGNRTSTFDALGNTTAYGYNKNNWLTSITDPPDPNTSVGTSTRDYDTDGRVIQICDQAAVCIAYHYDGDGRLDTITDGSNNAIRKAYGSSSSGLGGLPAATIYPTYREDYKYDSRNLYTQITVAVGDQQQTTTTAYNARGDLISSTDPGGRSTLFEYDALARRTKVTDALGGQTLYSYDNRNNILSIIDAAGNTSQASYDLADRATAEARPSGAAIRYDYNENGDPNQRTSPEGQRRVYEYDDAGRRWREDQYDVSGGSPVQTVTYTYDERNLLTAYAQSGDTQSSAAIVYDAKKQKKTETVTYSSGVSAFSSAIRYDYFANGQKKSITYPDGSVVAFGYTSSSQLASATIPHGGDIQFRGYNWNTATQIQFPGVVRNITLDALQRPTEIRANGIGTGTVDAPNGAQLMDFQYVYGATGNTSTRTTEDGQIQYAYDKLDRVVTATPPLALQNAPFGLPAEQYGYDGVNNRVSSAHQPGVWTYNADNQLLTYGSGAAAQTYQYDNNGNLRVRLTGDPSSPAITRTFSYTASGRLSQVQDNGTTVATYKYDPMGRRMYQQTLSSTLWFQYSDEGLIAEFSESGSPTRTYGWRPDGVWGSGPLWMADINGTGWTVHTYQNDVVGTPQRLANTQGVPTWKGVSEAYGRTVEVSSGVQNKLRFPGQREDSDTGLVYNYFRDYDPSIGRYIEGDPLGLDAGINLYAYAGDEPIDAVDFSGLAACPPTAVQFINKMCAAAKSAAGRDCPCKVMLVQSGFESGWGSGPTVPDNNFFGLHGIGDNGSRPAKKDPTVKLPINSSAEQSYKQYCDRCNQHGVRYTDDKQFITDVTKKLSFSVGTQPQYIKNILSMMNKCKDQIASCCASP